MRKKVFTKDCPSCKLCAVQDNSNFVCNWGKTPKLMFEPKGKKVLRCNLKNKEIKIGNSK